MKATTALRRACYKGHVDVVKVLLQNGAFVNATCSEMGYSGIHWAAQEGHVGLVNVLIQNGVDLTHVGNDGFRPLRLAVCCRNITFALELLCHGAAIDGSWTVSRESHFRSDHGETGIAS